MIIRQISANMTVSSMLYLPCEEETTAFEEIVETSNSLVERQLFMLAGEFANKDRIPEEEFRNRLKIAAETASKESTEWVNVKYKDKGFVVECAIDLHPSIAYADLEISPRYEMDNQLYYQ